MEKFCEFFDIDEIVFKKVGEDVFSMVIKSNINMNDKILKNSFFEAKLCKIDSKLELKMQTEYLDVKIRDPIIKSETFSIPLEIKLLLNKDLQNIFRIQSESLIE